MVRPILYSGVALLSLIAANAALAAEIEAKSTIGAVTLFPDAAIVTRNLDVDLPAGSSTLVLRALPATIDPASLRVEGQATARLALGAVKSRLRAADPQKTISENEVELKKLRADLGQINSMLDALEGRKAMVQRYAAAGPARDEKSAGLDVAQWGAAWDAVGQALVKVNGEILEATRRKSETEARIKALEIAENGRRARLAPEREFTVAVEADAPLKGALTISYRVAGAGWQPAYDARLTTEGKMAGGLTLARRALVTQRTGEDWTDVELTLSTVRARSGTAAPQVEPQRVSFLEALVGYAAPAPVRRERAPSMQKLNEVADAAGPAAAPAPQPIVAPEATLEGNGFQATYRLPGRITVLTDGSQKSLIVQSREIKPELLVKTAPALDPTAYLEAAFTNEEDAPLLPGVVSLIRDNSFIGRGRIAFTPPGDRIELGFGADERVKVSRVPLRRRETEPGLLGSTKSDTRDFKITIKNLHDFAVKTSIIDQIPYSEASNLTVDPLPTNTPPTEKIVNDKRGVMGWTYELKPKEEKEIRIGYRLRFPSDRELVFQRTPNARAN